MPHYITSHVTVTSVVTESEKISSQQYVYDVICAVNSKIFLD